MKKATPNYGYWVMGVFVALSVLNAVQKDYLTASMNLALSIVMGGSQVKSWDEVSPFMKVVVYVLTGVSAGLFGYIIATDVKN